MINPYSIYNFRYTVNIPLDEGITFDNNVGYLLYINVRKSIENATGMQIGINYDYKLFVIFTGELKQESDISAFFLLLIIPIGIIAVGASISFHKRKKSKNTRIILDDTPIPDGNTARRRIDGVLGGKDE